MMARALMKFDFSQQPYVFIYLLRCLIVSTALGLGQPAQHSQHSKCSSLRSFHHSSTTTTTRNGSQLARPTTWLTEIEEGS